MHKSYMFASFFYLMRARDLRPSFHQWMTLMEALSKGMANSSMNSFYNLCRATLITSEKDFDKFDEVFIEYFEDINKRNKVLDKLPERLDDNLKEWFFSDNIDPNIYFSEEHMEIINRLIQSIENMLKILDEQMRSDDFVVNCSVCVGCGACFKSNKKGVDLLDTFEDAEEKRSHLAKKDALSIAKERRFRDFREDSVLDIRQYHMAFRKLRQYSSRISNPRTELDIERTIEKTAKNAGMLKLSYKRPRKNVIKLIVLFDSDGSMGLYSELSSRIFQAVNRENHFKDLQFYYFHNCIYDRLYTTPECINGEWIDTDSVMKTHDSEYRVIYIGDASMADSELYEVGGNVLLERSNRLPGIEWLKRMKRRYNRSVWLNPIPASEWNRLYGGKSIQAVGKIFPMYELSLKGLESAIKRLV